ncbi:MAG: hypothetical protein U0800_20740 [Isosphaeraceae bacterium]
MESILASSTVHYELTSTHTAKQKTCLDLTYHVTLRKGASPAELVVQLNALEGVDNVELDRGE